MILGIDFLFRIGKYIKTKNKTEQKQRPKGGIEPL